MPTTEDKVQKVTVTAEQIRKAKQGKEPRDPLDFFARVTRRIYQDPRWSGKHPVDAFRVLCWMIDRTTENAFHEQVPGIQFGRVLGHAPVAYSTIARDLHCSWQSVRRSIYWLCNKGFVARLRDNEYAEYRYVWVGSDKPFKTPPQVLDRNEDTGDAAFQVGSEEIQFLDEDKPQGFTLGGDDDDLV